MLHIFTYTLIRTFGALVSILPQRAFYCFGKGLGFLIYLSHRSFRKKALSNLAIAFNHEKSAEERRSIAIESFQNLTLSSLEYFRLKKYKGTLQKLIEAQGGEEVLSILKQGQGAVFLSAHQANWEIPFLAITEHAPGIAIGRPIKNPWLYRWVLGLREMNGGKIIMPKRAIPQGIAALRAGKFVGVVGDQAVPQSSYHYPFFGVRAWTTTAPALMAYKTNSPLFVATTKRLPEGRYAIVTSPPFWPNTTLPLKDEVKRLMDTAMSFLEASIRERPGEWLWQHDRWKQQEIDHVKRPYRFGFILIILPPSPEAFLAIASTFREIYARSFLTFLVPKGTIVPLEDVQTLPYETEEHLCLNDWRYQLVLDFYDSKKARAHYKKRGAFHALSLSHLQKMGKGETSLPLILKKALCKCP